MTAVNDISNPSPDPWRDASVWSAVDFPRPRSWARELEPAQIAELDAAIPQVRVAGTPFHRITRADFPLPQTEALLAAVRRDLESGPGFAVIGGIPVERYEYEENVIACAGLSAYLGCIVDQSYQGAMIVDVRDNGAAYTSAVRGYNTAAALRFHTDGACLTGLLALGMAAEGGLSVLASAGTVYNAACAERPDLLPVLMKGFRHHRRGEHAPGEPLVSEAVPVFRWHHGLLHCVYDRNQSVWAQEAGVVMTRREFDALDFVDAVLARSENQLHMELRTGDFQLVNNFSVLHARTAYRDGDGKQRHLLRIWLDAPGSRWRGPTMRELYVRRDQPA